MLKSKYKAKRFLLPILSLVILSIVMIASVSSYLTISMFKAHMQEHIDLVKKDYINEHKNKIYDDVHFVKDAIRLIIISFSVIYILQWLNLEDQE